MSWSRTLLGDVVEIDRASVQPEQIRPGTLYVGLENISSDGTFYDVSTVANGDIASSKFSFNEAHVLFGKLRPYLKKVVRPQFSGVCSTDILPLRASKRIDKNFLYHWLRLPEVIELATSRSSGANLPRLSPSTLLEFQIPLPPLEEQKRIAALLDEADALRRKRRQAISKVEALLQSVFLEMFGDPVTNPKGWNLQMLGDLLERPAQNGAYYPPEQYSVGPNEGIEMVHMGDAFSEVVSRGKLRRVCISEKDTQKYALSENDILIARRSLVYEGAAKPCLIPKIEEEPLIYESSFIRITPKNSVMTHLYLFHFLSNQRAKARYVLPFVTRSTISGISQSNLVSILLPVPPFRLQQEFISRVAAIEATRKEHHLSLNRLKALFTTLQYQAFHSEPTSSISTQSSTTSPCLTLDF